MRGFRPWISIACVGLGMVFAGVMACGSSGDAADASTGDAGRTTRDASLDKNAPSNGRDSGPSPEADAGYDASAADALDAGADGSPLSTGPHASVRVIDLAHPQYLFLDVCFSVDAPGPSASWVGPMLRGSYDFLDNTVNAQTSAVTGYFDVAVGTRSLRLVPFDTSDCQETIDGIPDFSLDTPLADGSRSSIVLGGTAFDAGAPEPLTVHQFTDIVAPADAGNSVRFINFAQAEGAIDVYAFAGYGMKTPCTLLYDNIPFAGVGVATSNIPGDGGPTASNGYTPLRGVTLYDLCFLTYTLGVAPHGAGCGAAFKTYYSTDGLLAHGAWTFYVYDDNFGQLVCRDDGTQMPFCDQY